MIYIVYISNFKFIPNIVNTVMIITMIAIITITITVCKTGGQQF